MMAFNHGLSGYICAKVAMPVLRRHAALQERALVWAFFLGAMLPDLDIVARLWGREVYFSGAWYAHRHASHSLLGGGVLALAAAGLLYPWLGRYRTVGGEGAAARGVLLWLFAALWAGTGLHVFGDLFTPGWQLPVFWPHPAQFGGWRHIGWFTPYLLWLFVITVALGRLAEGVLRRRPAASWASHRGWYGALWGFYALAALRWVEFLVTSRYESGPQWHALQRNLLPEAMISPVTDGVRVVWQLLTN